VVSPDGSCNASHHDLWVLDTTSEATEDFLWRELFQEGLRPGGACGQVCAALDSLVYLLTPTHPPGYSAAADEERAALWSYDVAANSWRYLNASSGPIWSEGFCMVKVEGYLWVYGSSSSGTPELWVFMQEQSVWQRAEGAGDFPPARKKHGCLAVGGRLFVFSGEHAAMLYHDDLWMLEAVAGFLRPSAELVWTKLSTDVLLGTAPTGRQGTGMAALAGNAYIFGGYRESTAAPVNDFHGFTLPRRIPFPQDFKMLMLSSLYDWDTLEVPRGATAQVPTGFALCWHLNPCHLTISGPGTISGPIIHCRALDGCTGVELQSVHVTRAGLFLEGAPLSLLNSTVSSSGISVSESLMEVRSSFMLNCKVTPIPTAKNLTPET